MHRLCYLWVLASAPSLLASCAAASPCSTFKDADVVGIVRLDAASHPTRRQTESRGVIVKSYKGPLRPGMSIEFYGGGVCYDARTRSEQSTTFSTPPSRWPLLYGLYANAL